MPTHMWAYITYTIEEGKQILPLAKKEDMQEVTDNPNMTHCPLKTEFASVRNKVVFKETQTNKKPLYAHFCCVCQHGRTGKDRTIQFSFSSPSLIR